ncbi:hypothetical protein PUN28_019318 [Cardiocondyla obscurior]|uniref:Uncharacterized protein n=1 Tax=Cardiocondyla obscurior TaxID=286306 RepID=A0AAW2EC90_9HYME
MGQNVEELRPTARAFSYPCSSSSRSSPRLGHQGLFTEDLWQLYLQVLPIPRSRSSTSSTAIVHRACVQDVCRSYISTTRV